MVASKFSLIFLIILSLQLWPAILLCNGMFMTLHTRMSLTRGIRVAEPLYYLSDFGLHFIKLWIGTPAQDLLLLMDTGSTVVWVACTPNYTCPNCPSSAPLTVFLPRNSSSALPVKCADPKCKDVCEIGGPCSGKIGANCSGTCPDYKIRYGSGASTTTGHLLTDTLSFPTGSGQITKFGLGCSVVSSEVPGGIAGFGRGNLSLPSQLGGLICNKFAYCLNGQYNGSMLFLGDIAVPMNMTLNYTPFRNNNFHYYVGLEAVSIGGKPLRLPSNISTTFDSNGISRIMIDSGTVYTMFPNATYNQIEREFASQIGYPRAPPQVEATTNFTLCYNVSGVPNVNIQFPVFAFHFSGGLHMILPHNNCFKQFTSDTYCLAFFGADLSKSGAILGNYQQKDFYILYDMEMNSFGFTQVSCKKLV